MLFGYGFRPDRVFLPLGMNQPLPLPDKVGVGGGDGEIIHRLDTIFGFNFFDRAGGAVGCLEGAPGWRASEA